MSLSIIRLGAAREDIVEIATYLAEKGQQVAERFLVSLESTLHSLADMPKMGTVYRLSDGQELRRFRVGHFDNYLLFYRVFDDRVELVRVIHGARDIPNLLQDF